VVPCDGNPGTEHRRISVLETVCSLFSWCGRGAFVFYWVNCGAVWSRGKSFLVKKTFVFFIRTIFILYPCERAVEFQFPKVFFDARAQISFFPISISFDGNKARAIVVGNNHIIVLVDPLPRPFDVWWRHRSAGPLDPRMGPLYRRYGCFNGRTHIYRAD